MTESWTWDESLFAGAAEHYTPGRLPYAPGLAEALREALGLDGSGRLLDVGCGPGTVTLPFAAHFEQAIGLDPDRGMLAEAGRLAAERGVPNCSWVNLKAEQLPAGLGTFRAVTFAASFHWMDRELVARTVRTMLEPGGAVVHVDNRHQDGVDPDPGGTLPGMPNAAIGDLVTSYLGPGRHAGQGIRNGSPNREDLVFQAAGFSGPQVVVVPDGRALTRTVDDCVHAVLSKSQSAPHLFGEQLNEFVADLRELLEDASADGQFAAKLPGNWLWIYRPI